MLDTIPAGGSDHRKGKKVLAIGVDAAEWTLVKKWADEGKLPTFKRMMDGGVSAVLSSTCAEFPDSIWSSAYSGANPATYEKYFYVGYDPATGGLRHVKDTEFTDRPFWKILSDAGRRVGVVDASKYGLTEGLNGFQIANWGTHATKSKRGSIPPELFEEAETRFGPHGVGDIDMMDNTIPMYVKKRDDLVNGVKRHGMLHRWLIENQDWDVIYCQFAESHQVGHFYWHFYDEQHPLYRSDDPHGLSNAMFDVYRAIDDEVGKMIEAAGPDAVSMVFATHGMGPLYHATWYLPEMLDLLGFGQSPPRQVSSKRGSVNPWRVLKQLLPGRLQYAIKGMLPQTMQDWLIFRWYMRSFDPSGKKAFAVPSNDAVALIRIGVKGRDKGGVVEPEDYRKVCEQVRAALYELTDPVSGIRVVAHSEMIHEKFHGPYLDSKPDLSVVWDTSVPWNTIHSPRFGTLQLKNLDSRTGSHTSIGFFLATGPGIPEGVTLDHRSTYDICPTILETAGVAVPGGLDGSAMPIVRTPALV